MSKKSTKKITKSNPRKEEIFANTATANTASPNEGDIVNTTLPSKKGKKKVPKSSEMSDSAGSNSESAENFQKPSESTEIPDNGMELDDGKGGEIQEGKTEVTTENKIGSGNETSEDESEENNSDDSSEVNDEDYFYPMKVKMQIYGDWFPVDNFPNPNPADSSIYT